MKRETGRVAWLDTARGFALLLVLFGHCFRDSMRQTSAVCAFLYDFVYAFHVPTLFLISGMCYALGRGRYRAQPLGCVLVSRLRAYMLPWLSYSLLMLALFALAQRIGPLARLLPAGYRAVPPFDYLRLMLRNENPYAFHLWYLYTLFLFFAFTRALDGLCGERAFRWALLAAIVLCNAGYLAFAQGMCWAVKSFFQQLTFFLAGVLIAPGKVERRRGALITAGAVCALGVAALLLVPGLAALDKGTLAQQALSLFLRRVLVAGMILCILAAASVLHACPASRSLSHLGSRSMAWYLYHQPLCCAMLGGVLYDKLGAPLALTVLACLAASLVVPAWIVRLVRTLHLDGLCRTLGLPC